MGQPKGMRLGTAYGGDMEGSEKAQRDMERHGVILPGEKTEPGLLDPQVDRGS